MKKTEILFLITLLFWSVINLSSAEPQPALAPLNPAFIAYQEKLKAGKEMLQLTEEGRGLGYVPAPRAPVAFEPVTKRLLGFPAYFDLRTQSPPRLSPVKDQGACGSCWTFATYGSMESCQMTVYPTPVPDYSENNMKNTHGFDWGCCDGGQMYMATAYLARYGGPVNEAADPYNPNNCSSPSGLTLRKHVQQVIMLPPRTGPTNNDYLKSAVQTYGAVYTCFYWNSSYYNSANKAYYYNGGQYSNHAVCIVGWDDNFSRYKFNTTPPGDGAFIIKNSWGSSWGENGYFYISYYDSRLGYEENALFVNPDDTSNYSTVYQYDPLGWVSDFGGVSSTAWFANKFTATEDHTLRAASWYTAMNNVSYELWVYLNPNQGPINTDGYASYQQGTITYAGYNTVPLETPVPLNNGQTFSIVVKQTTPGYNYPIPIECRVNGYSSGATSGPGQSYYSLNGTNFYDLYNWNSTANVCLKGFAKPVTGIITVVSSGDPFKANSSFTVDVIVSGNTTGKIPKGYNLKVVYNTNSVTYQGIGDAPGYAFNPVAGSEQGSGPEKWRHISGSDSNNSQTNPVLCRISFQTTSFPNWFDIAIADDPISKSTNDALYDQQNEPIAHYIDTSGTQTLPVRLDWLKVE